MARIRSIKPDFFTSPDMAEHTIRACLTFIGLWTHVDDAGRCLLEPRLIHAALYALRPEVTVDDVRADLVALHELGQILCYEHRGRRYLQVATWSHQKIDRPSDSKLPALDAAGSCLLARAFDEGSPNAQRRVVEGSLPDRDQGKDLDQGQDLLPPAPALQTVVDSYRPRATSRSQDERLWDALEHELGPAATTTERANRGRTRKELEQAGATPADVHHRCREYRNRFPNMALTDAALRKHWSQLAEAQIITAKQSSSTTALINAGRRMGILREGA